MAYDVIGTGYQLNRHVNVDISYETKRGYGNAGNVAENRESPHVFVRYNIKLYTRPGHYFAYPIYISNIEFGGHSLYGGTEIKDKRTGHFDFTYTTPWGAYQDTDTVVTGAQVVLTDSVGGYLRTGYYDLKTDARVYPAQNRPSTKPDITPYEYLNNTVVGKLSFNWKQWGGDYPAKIQVSRLDTENYFDVPVTQPITIDVEPGKEYRLSIRGISSRGEVGYSSGRMSFIAKPAPKLLPNQLLTLGKNNTYILQCDYYLQDTKLKILDIEKELKPNSTITFTNEELEKLFKYYGTVIEGKVISTVDGNKAETKVPLYIDTNGDVNTIYIDKKGIKKGQVYIKINNEIRKGIIFTKKNGRIVKGG